MKWKTVRTVLADCGCVEGEAVPRYGRWQKQFQEPVDCVRFTAPDGCRQERPAFVHQPAVLAYDEHGYEKPQPDGPQTWAVRFTPDCEGTYAWQAFAGGRITAEGSFVCTASDHHGYVEISRKDPRYFAYTDGTPLCLIGLNLTWPDTQPAPSGTEFGITSDTCTTGCISYERWFSRLAAAGGNYARLWLGKPYFNAETGVAGETDPLLFAALDQVIGLARKYGIRLKMTMEQFRFMTPQNPDNGSNRFYWTFAKELRHPVTGEVCPTVQTWLTEGDWQQLWRKKFDAYLARYADDPVVMAWELWNECNAISADRMAIYRMTADTLRWLKPRAPRQFALNSLGSYDAHQPQDWWYAQFRDLPEMDYQQAHRYLDQGAPFEICHSDPCVFLKDVMPLFSRPDKPAVVAETGAVNDCHSGPFRFYSKDDRGLIFADCSFAPFFAGSAGTGQMWHWDERYVESKNLLGMFAPFAQMVQGVALDEQGFEPVDLSNDKAFCMVLKGKDCLLGYLRHREDSWYHTLRDGLQPERIETMTFHLPDAVSCAEVFRIWQDDGSTLEADGEYLTVHGLTSGCLFRLTK